MFEHRSSDVWTILRCMYHTSDVWVHTSDVKEMTIRRMTHTLELQCFWKRFDTKWLPDNKGTRKRQGPPEIWETKKLFPLSHTSDFCRYIGAPMYGCWGTLRWAPTWVFFSLPKHWRMATFIRSHFICVFLRDVLVLDYKNVFLLFLHWPYLVWYFYLHLVYEREHICLNNLPPPP